MRYSLFLQRNTSCLVPSSFLFNGNHLSSRKQVCWRSFEDPFVLFFLLFMVCVNSNSFRKLYASRNEDHSTDILPAEFVSYFNLNFKTGDVLSAVDAVRSEVLKSPRDFICSCIWCAKYCEIQTRISKFCSQSEELPRPFANWTIHFPFLNIRQMRVFSLCNDVLSNFLAAQ